MAIGNIIYSSSSTTIVSGDVIHAADFERSTNLQVDTVSGNLNIAGGINTGSVSNLGSNSNVKISGGSDGQVLRTDGSSNLSWTTIGSSGFEFFTSSTTWVVPAGVTKIHVKALGGGGGGARWTDGVLNRDATGGGAGGYVEGFLEVTPGQSYTITVGAGGTGATENGGGGFAGGSSSFRTAGGGTIWFQAVSGGGGLAGSSPPGGSAGGFSGAAALLFGIAGRSGGAGRYESSGKSIFKVGNGNGSVNPFSASPVSILIGFFGDAGTGGTSTVAPTQSTRFGSGGAAAWSVGNGQDGRPGFVAITY